MDNFIGPVIPKGYEKSKDSSSSDSEDNDIGKANDNTDAVYGPALPPNLKEKSEASSRSVIGPALPPNFRLVSKEDDEIPGEDDSDDDDIIGPVLPPSDGTISTSFHADFERRSKKMKDKLTGKLEKPVQRESWMIELPEAKAKDFGLGPRTFSRRDPGMEKQDSSDWTDTPADKLRKSKEGSRKRNIDQVLTPEEMAQRKRDSEIRNQVEAHNSKSRSKSLVEIHKKKCEKGQEDSGSKVRKPFDRDTDLQVNRFDDAQKKSIMKKAQGLNSRFSHGKISSNFL